MMTEPSEWAMKQAGNVIGHTVSCMMQEGECSCFLFSRCTALARCFDAARAEGRREGGVKIDPPTNPGTFETRIDYDVQTGRYVLEATHRYLGPVERDRVTGQGVRVVKYEHARGVYDTRYGAAYALAKWVTDRINTVAVMEYA